MGKKSITTGLPAEIAINVLLENMDRKFSILREGWEADREALAREFRDWFDRIDTKLERLDLVELSQRLMSGQLARMSQDIGELKTGQVELRQDVATLKVDVGDLKAQMRDVADSSKRHDVEIIKLWTANRPTRRR